MMTTSTRIGAACLAAGLIAGAPRLVAQGHPERTLPTEGQGRVTVLDAASLRAMGIQSLADGLRLVPGLDVVRTGAFAGGSATLGADGGTSGDIVVRWDGVPLADFAGAVDLSHLTLDGVERIEVRRGVAADLAGAGSTAAVIDILTAPGRVARGPAVGVLGGSDRTLASRAEAAAVSGPLGVSAAGSTLRGDGGMVPGERYSRRAGGAGLRLVPASRMWVLLSGRRGSSRYAFPSWDIGLSPPSGAGVAGLDQIDRGMQETVSLEVGGAIGSRLAVSARVGRDRRDLRFVWAYFDSAAVMPMVEERASAATRDLVAVRGTYRVARSVEMTATFERDRREGSMADVFRRDVDPASPAWLIASSSASGYAERTTAWGLGVSARRGPWSAAGQWRRDARGGHGLPITWRALASWTSPGGTEAYVGGRSGFREASPLALGLPGPGGPAMVGPQRSRLLEVGLSQRLARGRLTLAAALISARITDFLAGYPIPTQVGFDAVLVNAGTARARGFELRAQAQPIAAMHVEVAYTHLPATAVSSDLPPALGEFWVGHRLMDRPADIGLAVVALGIGRHGLVELAIRHEGPRLGLRSAQAFTPDTLRGHTTVDIGGSVRLVPPLSVVFRVENLLGVRYVERIARDAQTRLDYPGGGRAAMLGVEVARP